MFMWIRRSIYQRFMCGVDFHLDIGLDGGGLSISLHGRQILHLWTFYLWGTVKDQVCQRKPLTLEELRQEITAAYAAISIKTLTEVTSATASRSVGCLAANGQHFEHLQ
ncbi:hypothetical protein C0J52_12508 [Blattella germanica]|nr:hypothetical protein C0J52_12508 [Blattella germanica]